MKINRVTKLGFIATILIAMFIWGFNYLKGKNFFDKGNRYYAVYDRVDGLNKACAVIMNGFKIGIVDELYFKQDQSGKLIVEFIVEKKYNIPKNSIAQIFSVDLMGTRAIRIIRSDVKDKYYNPKDTVKSGIEGDLKDQVNQELLPLKRKAEDLISSFDSVLTTIRVIFNETTRQNLTKSFLSIKNTLTTLEHTTFTLDTLLTTEKSKLAMIFSNLQSITSNFKNNNDLITNVIKNFSKLSDSIAKSNIASTINKTNLVLGQVNTILTKVNAGQGSLGALLNNDSLYINIQNATYNLNRLLRDFRENPKRYLHFSAVDLGKTVYILDPEDALKEMQKKKKPEKKENKK